MNCIICGCNNFNISFNGYTVCEDCWEVITDEEFTKARIKYRKTPFKDVPLEKIYKKKLESITEEDKKEIKRRVKFNKL